VMICAAAQVMLRLAPGAQLQALVQNDGGHPEHLSQGTPVQVYLAPARWRCCAAAPRTWPSRSRTS
jgi:hypothetical protein